MALTPRAWAVDLTFRDNDANTSTMTVYVDDATIYADVETLASGLVAAAGAISDAPIVAYTVSRRYVTDTPLVAPEISDVEKKGYFAFRLADSRLTSVSVPSIKGELVLTNSNIINLTNPLVAAFIAAIQTGGTDRIGVSIDEVEKAEKRHVKNRKG